MTPEFNKKFKKLMEMVSADVISTGENAPYEGDDPAGLQGDFYARGDARTPYIIGGYNRRLKKSEQKKKK